VTSAVFDGKQDIDIGIGIGIGIRIGLGLGRMTWSLGWHGMGWDGLVHWDWSGDGDIYECGYDL
jgi:hypothetical protein